MSTTVEEFLTQNGINAGESIAQSGVIGMRWGRRKNASGGHDVDKSKTAGAKREGGKFQKPEPKPTKEHPGKGDEHQSERGAERSGKKLSEVSDTELSSAIKRLQLEQQYTQLTAPKANAARQIMTEILINSGKAAATQFTTQQMSKGLNALAAAGTKAALEAAKKK